ncbi:hypothetical protein DRQ25_17130 [Candidatus Fermentibacteria bacterium]|nr:MAG: hypothetical protein DRQ25_17130 [Candidatus Fermentibacteria bacterium]
MAFDPLTAALSFGETVIDKMFPDPAERDRAKLEMLKLQKEGQFRELELQMSAIIAEAKSADPWTSRARPSFLYVMYVLILAAIPMGIISAFNPEVAVRIGAGLKAWLDAVPENLWTIFGLGYTGYTVARSAWDKKPLK